MLVRIWLYTGVYTCTLCSCEHQRWRGKKKQWEGWPQWRGGLRLFVHKNGLCVGPGPPSLILYQLTLWPHPQTHTSRGNWLAPDTFPLFYSSSFPFCSLLLFQDLLHSLGWAFLKLQVWSPSVTKEEDENRHVCGGTLCVRVIYHALFPIVSVALQESFRLSRVAWLCDVRREADYDVMLSSISALHAMS